MVEITEPATLVGDGGHQMIDVAWAHPGNTCIDCHTITQAKAPPEARQGPAKNAQA